MRSAGLIVLLTLATFAQALTILPPPDRFVTPGEFVTLVFRIEATATLAVDVTAASASGWRILRQPETVQLAPGRGVPVAVTIEVPSDAPALHNEQVMFNIALATERHQSSVVLTVSELINFALEVPREVALTAEGFTVIVANLGNSADKAVLSLLQGNTVLAEHTLQLAPGERLEKPVNVSAEGLYTLVLTSARGTEVRRNVNAIRFGPPSPEPFRLAATITNQLDTSGSWRSGLTIQGPLSDFATLEARILAPTWQRSFAEVAFERFTVRLGGGWHDPLGFGLSGDFGLAGSLVDEAWGVALALGWLEEGHFNAIIAGALTPPGYRLGGALGIHAGRLLAQLRAEVLKASWTLAAEWRYRQGTLDVALSSEIDDLTGHLQLGLEAQALTQPTARLTAKAVYREGMATAYGDVTVPLAPAAEPAGRFGIGWPLATSPSGLLRLAAQLGTAKSFTRVTHQVEAADGWRLRHGFGLRYDAVGLGLELNSSWMRSAANSLGFDTHLVYYPSVERLDGHLGLRYQLALEPLTIALSSGLNLGEQSLGTSASLTWHEGPWRATLGTSLAYGYATSLSDRWALSARLDVSYTFAVDVPPALVAASGGRRLGTLDGTVLADGAPLPGIALQVGRYRLESDESGRFRAELPPGRYRLVVDLSTLPVAYRLLEADVEVDIAVQEVTTVAVQAVATTTLRGRVLEDRDGDGTPDEPARGVAARLLLTDAEGLRRTVLADEAGRFEMRGLLPGPVEVQLVELPLGATVVGDDRQTVQLAPGVPAEVTFSVQPLTPQVQMFPAQALRIRNVEVETERVPPGAAPLLKVQLQGEADSVQVVTLDATHELTPAQGIWTGRVSVPLTAAPGVYGFTVIARAADAETTRRGQVVVDTLAPALELASSAPVRPGEDLHVIVTTYFMAASVTVSQPFGSALALVEEVSGRWAGTLSIPQDAEDAVYTLVVRAVTVDGRAYDQELRFRVLAP